MSNQEVEGTVNVNMQVDQQSLKTAVDAYNKAGQAIGKIADKAEGQLADIGKTAEASAKKVDKAFRNIQERSAGKIQANKVRVEGEAETARVRSTGKLAEQESKILTKIVEAEQRRATILSGEESKKRLIIFRAEEREKRRLSQVSAGGGSRGGGALGVVGRLLTGGGGGGIAGSFLSGLAGGFGIGVGGYAVARGAEALVAAEQQATAYDRQRIAAEKLSGSQEALNALLEAYGRASGGAVNQVTSLETVTRLLATGYAETVPQLERFVRATRGASISLGKPQENIAQETQLAISNTSVKRLDQIGLGIDEVTQRVEELRAANSSLTREMAFGEAVLGLLEEKYGALADSTEGQATAVEKLAVAWDNLGLSIGQAVQGPLNAAAAVLGSIFNWLDKQFKLIAEQERRATVNRDRLMAMEGFTGISVDDIVGMATGKSATQVRAQRVLNNNLLPNSPSSGYIGGPEDSRPVKPFQRGEEIQALIDSAYDNVEQVEKNANRERLQEIESYESQRESIINNYGKMVVREEQDFARQRARSLRDYERAIVDVMRDAQDREREMQEDLDRQIADAKEDSNERLSDIEEDYNDQREKAEEDHRDAMLKAAGQLDAIAVLEERKRFKKEQEERNKQHNKAIEDEKESLQERINDAVEAHAERLEDAREADEKRLEDMRVARERQLADEDEDRKIRLERAAEDHQDQLNELDRQHADRMQQIKDQAAEQTKEIQDALANDLAEAGFYIKGMTEIMNERKKLQEEWFDAMIERMERDIEYSKRREQIHDPRTTPERVIPEFARGGPVTQTGLAYVHAGEYVVPASNSNNQLSNSSLVIQDGAFRISTTPGMELAVGEEIESVLIKLLERV